MTQPTQRDPNRERHIEAARDIVNALAWDAGNLTPLESSAVTRIADALADAERRVWRELQRIALAHECDLESLAYTAEHGGYPCPVASERVLLEMLRAAKEATGVEALQKPTAVERFLAHPMANYLSRECPVIEGEWCAGYKTWHQGEEYGAPAYGDTPEAAAQAALDALDARGGSDGG